MKGTGRQHGTHSGYKGGCRCGSCQKAVADYTRSRYCPEYAAWLGAKKRTTNPRHPGWINYGGRGIRMCNEWVHSYATFLAHIGPKPNSELTLDRIDNNRNYEPGNVRWTTKIQQQNNRRPYKARRVS